MSIRIPVVGAKSKSEKWLSAMRGNSFRKGLEPVNKKAHLKKECPCGISFFVIPARDKKAVYCSRSCAAKYSNPKNWKGGITSDVRCFDCNIAITPYRKRCQDCFHKIASGETHGSWKGGITPINHKIRTSTEYKKWRKHVFERDDYTCQACGKRGTYLHADHELPFALYPDLRLEILNGRTLCIPCHRKTPTWGNKVFLPTFTVSGT